MTNGLDSEASSAATNLLLKVTESVLHFADDNNEMMAWRVELRPDGTRYKHCSIALA
jgi:hypothetical protein